MLRLGVETDTLDYEGTAVRTMDLAQWRPPANSSELNSILTQFVGDIRQRTPVYSAVHIRGTRAYKLARRGALQPGDMPMRDVRVHSISADIVDNRTVKVDVSVGPGTYVRQLCADIAEAMGVCGHLVDLRRTSCGPFDVDIEPPSRDALPGSDHWALHGSVP